MAKIESLHHVVDEHPVADVAASAQQKRNLPSIVHVDQQ